tara:strand:- start:89 stop:340 length:252 start_codon:yes stop_codon:yes gene_type:complete
MAVPSSSTISLAGIWNEIDSNDYNASNHSNGENISLKGLSRGNYGTIETNNSSANRPNGTAPHDMSEFYSYNHDEPSAGGGKK